MFEWLKTILGDAYTEEIDKKVAEEIGKAFVAKADFNTVNEAKKKLDADLKARDVQLEDLKKTAGANEDLKKQIDTLQADNKTAADKYAADLKDLTLTNAIKIALAGKVHDEALVAGLVDKSKLIVNDEKVVGLEDQLKGLQESKAFLFKTGPGGDGGKGDDQKKGGFKVGAGGKEGDPQAQPPKSLRDAIAASMNTNKT